MKNCDQMTYARAVRNSLRHPARRLERHSSCGGRVVEREAFAGGFMVATMIVVRAPRRRVVRMYSVNDRFLRS